MFGALAGNWLLYRQAARTSARLAESLRGSSDHRAYLQAVLGYTALQAGVRTLPFAVAMMVVSPLSPMLVRRLGTTTL